LENAIKFSLYNHSGSVSINLQAFVDEHDQLCLSIQNPYKPEGETRQRGTGFGIRGVKRRLFLLFGRTDLLETFKDGQHFQCTLRIPQREYPEGYDL